MAVIEIAKIQIRRGQESVTGSPTLDSGEFGWSIDTQNLYIGNGTLAEGAPEVGKTRILTEKDLNLFNISTGTNYSYLSNDEGQHRANGVIVYTDPSGSASTYRKTADKLNDFVTVYDFAGIGDGITDNAQALQNAIDQIWLNSDKNSPRSRVALRIPAGVYLIYDTTIYLPPYTTLIGDGQDKTVIRLMSTVASGPGVGLFQTCDVTSTPGNYVVFQPGSSVLTDEISNIQLVGLTIEWDPAFANGGGLPVDITKPILRLDAAVDTQIIDCRFNGYYPVGQLTFSAIDYSAIELRGQGAITTRNLIIQNSTIDGFYYGIFSDYDIEDVTISNCTFRNLVRGVVGAQSIAAGNQIGPIRTKIVNNNFTNVEQEAIYFYANATIDPTYNLSMNNTFVEVGNFINGDISADTSIINFQSAGCKSVGDYFNRLKVVNDNPGGYYFQELVEGIAYFEETGAIEKSIDAGTAELSRFPIAADTQALKVQYSLRKTGIARKGDLLINVDRVAPTVTLTDNYSYTGANNGLIEFQATINTVTNVLSLVYENTGLAGGTITYKYSQLQ